MTPSKHEQKALRKILQRAHQEKEKLKIGDQWRERAMDRIRNFGPIGGKPTFLLKLEQLVWRLAPVTCLLILGLTLLFYSANLIEGYDAIQLLMNGAEELTLVQLFGL
jgi:hypothetical protein